MTSSEDNRVSIPPQRSGIGLTDDPSCDSSQQLAFHSVVFYWFFTGTYKLEPICQIYYSGVQVLWVSAAAREHVKFWIRIIGSCLAGPLAGLLQGSIRINCIS